MRVKIISKTALFCAMVLAAAFFSSCASQTKTLQDAYPAFYEEEAPHSILVMPPINLTNNVDAKDYFYYTLQAALANKGYYVFPPLLSMNTLQENSAYDAELFLESDITAFRKTFGADMLLFTKITNWKKHPIGGIVDVEIEYIFRSTVTGETVYRRKGVFAADTSFKSGLTKSGGILALVGLVVDAVGTAIKTAATDYTTVARACNYATIDVPAGRYSPLHWTDGKTIAGKDNLKASGQVGMWTDQVFFTPEQVAAAGTVSAPGGSGQKALPGTETKSEEAPVVSEKELSDNMVSGDTKRMAEAVLAMAQKKANTAFKPYALNYKTSSGTLQTAIELPGGYVLGFMQFWKTDRRDPMRVAGEFGFILGQDSRYKKNPELFKAINSAAKKLGWQRVLIHSNPWGAVFPETIEKVFDSEEKFREYLADSEKASGDLAEVLNAFTEQPPN